EGDAADESAATVKGTADFSSGGDRAPNDSECGMLITRRGEPCSSRTRRHEVARVVFLLDGPFSDDDIGGGGEQFTARGLELETCECACLFVEAGDVVFIFDGSRGWDGLRNTGWVAQQSQASDAKGWGAGTA